MIKQNEEDSKQSNLNDEVRDGGGKDQLFFVGYLLYLAPGTYK